MTKRKISMLLTMLKNNGESYSWPYISHGAIDKLVAAIKENEPDWAEIKIVITR